MPPHEDTSIIVAEYIETLAKAKINKTYILLTRSEGMVYKRLNKILDDGIIVESDNELYAPYTIPDSEILEMWEYRFDMGRSDKKPAKQESDVIKMFRELKRELSELKAKMAV